MGLDHITSELDHMRRQITRQRKEIQTLARAGIDTASAQMLLARMQDKVDGLMAERDRLRDEARRKYPGTNKAIYGTPSSRRA